MARSYNYYKERLKDYRAPYLILDAAYFEKNIRMQEERANDRPIRIASKSIRCPELIFSILARSNQFKGVMGYKHCESLYLLQKGLKDLLMGYPLTSKEEIKSLAVFQKKGASVCFMVDCIEHLMLLDGAAKDLNMSLSFCLDMDMSVSYPGLFFGVHRSPVRSLNELKSFVNSLKDFPHLRFRGLMGYEAQIAGVPDKLPGKPLQSLIIPSLKRNACKKIKQRRYEALKYLRTKNYSLDLVNGGGTGSIEFTMADESVTELTIGSGFFGPHLFDHYTRFKPFPALFFGLSISRIPTKNTFTCQGAPLNASGGIDTSKAPLPYLPIGGNLTILEGVGEVQTPVFFKDYHGLGIGDPLFFRHAKSGEPAQFFRQILFVDEDCVQSLDTYGGLGIG